MNPLRAVWRHSIFVATGRWAVWGWLLGGAFRLAADTSVLFGTVQQISSPTALDLEGEMVYAINFSANDPGRSVRGVLFLPDRLGVPGAELVGPQQVTAWQTKPEFGSTPDANALEEILHDIRWANTGANERLRATLQVQAGEEYKLQILISGNGPEDRRWDIRVDGRDAVDEITSLGAAPGQSYARNRSTLYSAQFVAARTNLVIEMGQLFGANDGGDRNPIWQALTLERVTAPPTPDDVVLEPDRFFPTQTLPIAHLQAVDRRFSATHQFTFVSGVGDTDNAKFSLQDADLMPRPFDFTHEPAGRTYSIRVRATDATDARRFLEKAIVLTLAEPHAPTGVTLDAGSLSGAALVGTEVGKLLAKDADAFDRHEFTLVNGAGDNENGWFVIQGQSLKLARQRPSGANEARLRIRATDRAGLSVETPLVLPVVEPRIRLNEILASEVGGIVDETRQPQEWIELKNLLPQAVDLTGWFLTDDRNNLRKWAFPARTLPPDGFIVVLADGTGVEVPGSTNLHANFSLSATGEWMALVRPDGVTIADVLNPPPQYPGVAYGYGPDGTAGFLPKPTPGQPNGTPVAAGENSVTFSREHAFLTNSFDLQLTASVPGSEIRYTLDGTRPTLTTGTVYSGPIPIRPNTNGTTRGVRIVRALAVHASAAYAPVATQTYLFVNGVEGPTVDGVVSQTRLVSAIVRHTNYARVMDKAFLALPALSVVMVGAPTTAERLASIELVDPGQQEPGFQTDCGIEATGTTSLGSPKLSMAARFRPEYGRARLRYPVYARGSQAGAGAAVEFKELRLRSHSHDTFYWLGTKENPPTPYGSPAVTRSGDAQLTRNLWIEEMQLLMGQPGKHGRQVHLYLNGSYHGIYHIQEHADEDFMASYYPGSAEDFHFTGAATTGSEHSPGDTWSTTWSTLKASLGNYTQARRWVDVTNLCDYMILSFYAGNDWDWSAQHNWGAAGPRFPDRGGWKFFQQDSDVALQDVNADCTDQDVPDGIFTRLMAYPDFKVLFRDRVYRHCFGDGWLTPVKAAALYDARMNEIFDAIVAETARWQPGTSVGRLPWDRDDEWANEWRYFRQSFFPQRTARFLTQLRKHAGWWPIDPPTLQPAPGVISPGTQVALAAGTGQIWFTTDGSDPRLPGGSVAPTARRPGVAGGPRVLIPAGSVWRFQDDGSTPAANWASTGFNDTTWHSGAAEIGYGDGDEVTTANFIDTDPNAPGVQRNITTYFRRNFDAPELANYSKLRVRLQRDDGAVVYLNGRELWRSNMPEGTVTPDTLAVEAVIGADEATFVDFEIPTAGLPLTASGNLLAVELHQASRDSGDISFNLELIAEATPSGNLLQVTDRPLYVRFRTQVGNDWSPIVEGYFVPEGLASASAESVVISEIQFHPLDVPESEFIELLNTSGQMVDLTGSALTNGVSFRFPPGSVLPPGGRAVVVRDLTAFEARYQAAKSPYRREGLVVYGPWAGALDNGGETIDLIAADGSPILSCTYATDGAWPGRADGNGSSLELEDPAAAPTNYVGKSAWLADPRHWRASSEFYGSPGAPGRGPDNRVLINEVLAAPLLPGGDGIELMNASGTTLAIGGWFVSDSSDNYRKYRLPDGTELAPSARLVLLESDFGNPANPACRTPFGLNELGDDVFLVEADAAGALLRFVDRVEFGGMPRGLSVGHFPDLTGPWVWLHTPTLGIANSFPEPGYEAWMATAFPGGTPFEEQRPEADPDRDGILNFAEYAFALSPNRPDAPPLEILGTDAEGRMLIQYRTRTGAVGIHYSVEVSSDLRTWDTTGARLEPVAAVAQPDGSTWVTQRVLAPLNAPDTAAFVRVRLSPF